MNLIEEIQSRTVRLERAQERLDDLHKAAALQQHQIRMHEESIAVEEKHLKELQELYVSQNPEGKE